MPPDLDVIFDGRGAGQQLSRIPLTGNETVLDAAGQLSGLTVVSDAQRIWVTRPTEAGCAYQMRWAAWRVVTAAGGGRPTTGRPRRPPT